MRAISAILAIGLCAKAEATTIVAIWTPSKLVIAGDSLLNNYWTAKNGVRQHTLSRDCKIRKFGSNYVSAAGNYHIQKAGFDLWQTAAHACGTSANVELCAARFKAELVSVLSRTVGVHDVHLTALVAGRQNGVPALEHITIVGERDGRLSVHTESFRQGKQAWGRVILGDRAAIDSYEKGTVSTMADSAEEQAVSLVRIEAWAMPQEVGAPFSTLIIDEDGDHWVNGGCCSSSCTK